MLGKLMRMAAAGSGSDSSYGYFVGGSDGVIADRITFSTGVTSANTVSNLSLARGKLAGLSDGSTYGYFAGGMTGSSGPPYNTVDRITFSTGATAAHAALSQARYFLTGLSDGSTYGYFAGGSTGNVVATADRVTFSTSAIAANAVSNLSAARYVLTGLSDGSTYGYFAGGVISSGAKVNTADRITFSTGVTAANAVSNLSVAKYGTAGLSDGSTYGYFAGGVTGSSNIIVNTADRITFSTGATAANTVSNLSQVGYGLAGLSDGSTYGYFSGYGVFTDRITFSTGATAANTVSNLSQARNFLAGLSDASV